MLILFQYRSMGGLWISNHNLRCRGSGFSHWLSPSWSRCNNLSLFCFLAYFIHTHTGYKFSSVKRSFTCFLSIYKLVMGLLIHTRWLHGSSQTSILCYVWFILVTSVLVHYFHILEIFTWVLYDNDLMKWVVSSRMWHSLYIKDFKGRFCTRFRLLRLQKMAISKKPVILKEVLVLTKEIPRVHSAPSSASRSRPGPVHKDAEFAFSSTCAQ
jgi:hypothetical protein